MSKGKPLPYAVALPMAEDLIRTLKPYFEVVEIAGSLRRKRPTVKDIEIVGKPTLTQVSDLFGNTFQERAEIDEVDLTDLLGHEAKLIRGGQRMRNYTLHYPELPHPVRLDLFMVRPPAQYGVIKVIRTGGASFSKMIVTSKLDGGLLPTGLKFRDGGVYYQGKLIETPTEKDFFNDVLGINFIPPEERDDYAKRFR